MSSIKISEKHGVNPSLDVCFWCGKDKGVALFGRMKGDAEAPRRAVTSYDPCDECEEKFGFGVALVEVAEYPREEGMPPIDKSRGFYPTGRWLVMKKDAADRLFNLEIEKRAFIDVETFSYILEEGKASNG